MSLREKKAEKKKEEMILSAMSVIAEKGYHATTMEDIAANLLMTKGAVYYYFKDKKDLVFESQKMLLEQSIKNVENVILEKPASITRLQDAMIVHIKYLLTERTGFVIGARPDQLFEDDQLRQIIQLRDQYSNYFDRLIEEGMEGGYFEEVDPKIVRNIILGAMNNMVDWYSPEGSMDKNELAKCISNYLLKILLKD